MRSPGLLRQDPVGDLRGILGDGPRLVVAALDQVRDGEPRARIRIEPGDIRILDLQRAEVFRELRGTAEASRRPSGR